MSALSRPDAEPDVADHAHIVQFDGVSWEDYERLLAIRGERSAPRITYLEGKVEIRSPSREHERAKSYIGCLVEAWCFERGVPFTPYGSWTLKERKELRGAEPDECYVFGAEVAERPQLAMEVVHSSGGIDKLEVYRRLGVQEVWYSGKARLQVHALRGDRYVPIATSEVLPGLDPELVARFLDRPSAYHAVRDFRAALVAEG